MFNLISNCLEITFVILQGYCLQFFYGSFLDSRFRRKWYAGILTTALYGAWKLGSGILWDTTGSALSLLKLFFTIGVLTALAIGLYRGAKRLTSFLVLAFITVNEISFFLSYMLLQLGNSLFDITFPCSFSAFHI